MPEIHELKRLSDSYKFIIRFIFSHVTGFIPSTRGIPAAITSTCVTTRTLKCSAGYRSLTNLTFIRNVRTFPMWTSSSPTIANLLKNTYPENWSGNGCPQGQGQTVPDINAQNNGNLLMYLKLLIRWSSDILSTISTHVWYGKSFLRSDYQCHCFAIHIVCTVKS